MVRGVKKIEIENIIAKMDELQELLEAVTSEMEEYFDERSEQWQEGEGGERYQEKMQDIDFIKGYIEEGQDILNEWIGKED